MKTTSLRQWVRMAAIGLGMALAASAADWNQWRGPQRDGVAPGFRAPATWSAEALAKRWTVAVGEGHASPLIVGDRVYVFTREGEEEVMRCLALADGRPLWREAYPAAYDMNFAARSHGKGPKSTPAVVGGRVFAFGIAGRLSAWDAQTGAVLWRREFAPEYKATAPDFGTAMSPLVDGDRVIVHVGGEDRGALAAFDVASGRPVWKWDGDGPGYTSPVLATVGGVRQLVTQSQEHCLAVAPADGKLLWKVPFSTPYDQNIVTPVVVGDLAIFAGVQKPMFALKVSAGAAAPAWETSEVTLYMSSPVVSEGVLYGLSTKQRGSLFALAPATGAVTWKGPGRVGENASLTDIGSALLVLADSGELTVQQKSAPGLKEIAKYKVADTPVWASPAVAGDRIAIKDKTSLILYQVGAGR